MSEGGRGGGGRPCVGALRRRKSAAEVSSCFWNQEALLDVNLSQSCVHIHPRGNDTGPPPPITALPVIQPAPFNKSLGENHVSWVPRTWILPQSSSRVTFIQELLTLACVCLHPSDSSPGTNLVPPMTFPNDARGSFMLTPSV